MKTDEIRDGFLPWSGLALGTVGFFIAHQLGADSTFQDCRVGSPLIVAIGTLVALLLIALGAIGSWRVYAREDEGPPRKLVATVGLLACGLYTIGVILPFIAALVIPRCWQ